MSTPVVALIGLIFGGVIFSLLTYSYFLWQEGSRQRNLPNRVKQENQERLKKALQQSRGGRNKQLSAVAVVLAALFFLCAFALLLGTSFQ